MSHRTVRRPSGWTTLAAFAALIAVSVTVTVHVALRPAGSADRESPADQGASEPTDVWAPLRVVGPLEAEHYPTIEAMRDSADAVVAGSFVSFGTRVFQGDAVEDVLVYLVAMVRVDEVLAGSLPDRTVPVEFLVPSAVADDAPVLATLSATLPRTELVFFLRHKRGDGEAGRYRVVNSTGLWAATGRSDLDTPLTEAPPEAAGTYRDELSHVASLHELKLLATSPAISPQ